VDPLKEVKAYREMEAAGYKTKAQIVAELGGDLDENLQQIAREKKLADELGVTLDADINAAPPADPQQLPASDGEPAPPPEAPRRARNSRRKKMSNVDVPESARPDGPLN
jgi:capsid protein